MIEHNALLRIGIQFALTKEWISVLLTNFDKIRNTIRFWPSHHDYQIKEWPRHLLSLQFGHEITIDSAVYLQRIIVSLRSTSNMLISFVCWFLNLKGKKTTS